MSKVSLEDLFSQIQAGEMKNLNLIVKADVQGSVEAVKASLEKAKPKATPEATDATNAPAASPNVPKADINPAA